MSSDFFYLFHPCVSLSPSSSGKFEEMAEGILRLRGDGAAQWVVEGYSTMLLEADQQVLGQTGGKRATHAIVPVGAGSIAQAVTQHYKRNDSDNAIVTVIGVEAATAACLKASLAAGKSTSVKTTPPSCAAWTAGPCLRRLGRS